MTFGSKGVLSIQNPDKLEDSLAELHLDPQKEAVVRSIYDSSDIKTAIETPALYKY